MSVNVDESSTNSLNEPLLDKAALTEDRPLCRTRERQPALASFATIVFAFIVVTGQMTQYVCLPLWIDSTTPSASPFANQTVEWKPTLDGYFVMSFASLSFVIVFGFVLLCCDCIYPKYLVRTEWSYRRLLLLVGFFQGISALFIVFSSSGKRTPPYLQAILGNFSIPITLLFR